jgi:hypothetical protein
LFNGNGSLATRPLVVNAPDEISFGGHFDIEVNGTFEEVGSVVLLRSDHNTHSFTSGDRYVKLSFQQKGSDRKAELRVRSPKLPAQAIPGIYMLFVLNKAGVPSIGRQIRLLPEL